jgi:hypothetical protein
MLRNLTRPLAGVVLASSLLSFPCQAGEPPLTVILDTDAGGDCDDIGALFLLHGAVERGEARLLGELGAEVCDTRLKCATLLSGSGDSSGGAGNGCVAACSRQLPGAQGRSVGFNGGGEVGAAGGELFYAGAPLRCRISGNCLFRGEGDLIQPRLCCGDGSIKSSDALCAFRRASTDRVTSALRLCAGRFSGPVRCTGADLGTASLR